MSIFINFATAVVSALVVPPLARWGGIFGATVGYVIANVVRSLGYYIVALYYMLKEKKKSE